MTPEQIEKALRQLSDHGKELDELRADIHAVAIIEIYHASGRVIPPQSSGTPLTASELNQFNAAMQRLNNRYAGRPRGSAD